MIKSALLLYSAFYLAYFLLRTTKLLTFFNVLLNINKFSHPYTIHMKKILLAFLVGTATLAVTSSCTKEYYDVVPSITMVYQRTANQWGVDELDTDYVDLNVPELRDYYVNQGIVNVAISFDDEQTYFAVPTTLDGIAYSYDYTTGSVRLYAQDPIEGGIAVPIPQHLFIKISLTEADFVQ